MSDLRLPSTQPAPASVSPGPTAAVRQAQAAFFRAALDQATPQPPSRQPQQPGAAPQAEAPRTPRPGALLDIRV